MGKFCEDLNDFIIEKAKDCNIFKAYSETNLIKRNKKHAKNKPWFDAECLKTRNDYYRVINKLQFTNNPDRNHKIKQA